MGQMIHKPDANPVVFAVCNLFLAGGLGYFLMGQKKKAFITWGVMIIGLTCTLGMCFPLVFIPWVTAYDAYLLGQKLQNGQSVGENENGLEFLNAVFKD